MDSAPSEPELSHDAQASIAAEIPAGRLRGLRRGDVSAFLGIRFAVGPRLDEAGDVREWTGVLDAVAFGAQAPQVGGALETLLGTTETSDEDCLHLNVWTPACDGARRPVLVWIHGGAFVTGSGSMPWYDGRALAERGDVVVVTINYRLGALGFLGDRNLGTLDMISALRWVNRNIAEMGGDPDQVTVFGESAGGSAAISLLAAPEADALFHRAWAMSPSIPQLRSAEQAAELERRYLALLDLDDAAGLLDRSVDDLLQAQATMMAGTASLRNFAPTGSTDVLPGHVLRTASADLRPLVVGTTRDEMALFTAFDNTRREWNDDDVQREFTARFDDPDEAISAYRSHRPNTNPSQLVSAMQTDEMFRYPAQRLATRRSEKGADTWVYEFHQRSTAFNGRLGACHGLDLPFVFHNLRARGAEMFTGGGDELTAIADDFSDALLTFARLGDPGWSPYSVDERATRIVGADRHGHADVDPEPDLRALWFAAP